MDPDRNKEGSHDKTVTFRRNEIFFKERKSIMINICDVTAFESGSLEQSLPVLKDLMQPLEKINFLHDKMRD